MYKLLYVTQHKAEIIASIDGELLGEFKLEEESNKIFKIEKALFLHEEGFFIDIFSCTIFFGF